MIGVYLFCSVIAIIGYFCVAVKIGFWVSDKTQNTGFDAGFYMMTVIGLLALPICIAVGVLL